MAAVTGGIPASENTLPLASSGQGGSIGTVLPGEDAGDPGAGDVGVEPVAPTSSSASTGWGQAWGFLWGGATLADERAAEAQERLLKQWREGPNIRSIAAILGRRWGELREVGLRLLQSFDLDTAEGEQLDMVGALVDLQRNGDGDPRYRQALRAWAKVLQSHATVDEILDIVRTFVGATPSIELTAVWPMGYFLELDTLDLEDLQRVLYFVRKATAAAYGFGIVVTLDTTALLVDLDTPTVVGAHEVDVIGVAVADPGLVATIYQ